MKAGNYWRWLKRKLSGDGVQLVSVTHDFKFEAPDGKQRASDALDTECVQTLAKHYPANRANAFLDWFTYSDNTIDGQSKKKAYDLFESGLLDSLEPGTVKCLQQIQALVLQKTTRNQTWLLCHFYTKSRQRYGFVLNLYAHGKYCPAGIIGGNIYTATNVVPVGVIKLGCETCAGGHGRINRAKRGAGGPFGPPAAQKGPKTCPQRDCIVWRNAKLAPNAYLCGV